MSAPDYKLNLWIPFPNKVPEGWPHLYVSLDDYEAEERRPSGGYRPILHELPASATAQETSSAQAGMSIEPKYITKYCMDHGHWYHWSDTQSPVCPKCPALKAASTHAHVWKGTALPWDEYCIVCGFKPSPQRPESEKANPPHELTLQDFGYAPGNYTIKCLDCGQEAPWCDKRAARCETCAKQAMAENRKGLAQNGEPASMSDDVWQPTVQLRWDTNGKLHQLWSREVCEWRAYGGNEMLCRRTESEWRVVPTVSEEKA